MAGEKQHEHERERTHATVAPQAGRAQLTCPACGNPVDTVVRRRKSLGIFVPEWGRGPCRSPECPQYAPAEG
ncbi:hypothetical protein VR44_06085 [Streptomyces katrae]|uniref:Uncharacterized protein n=1 Tax=Streptomyces katrae TaxID=68223 RepID=A0A0F4JWB0_9ACTN|nr:hypothetical protein VR44_06085 [Streptomyces katrae]